MGNQRLPLLIGLIASAIFVGYMLVRPGDPMNNLKIAAGYVLLFFILGLGIAVLSAIISGNIDLSQLLCDEEQCASMARFQLLVFTFVIALCLFLIVAASGKFPQIPGEVLTLLGISATTFAVSKGVDASTPPTPKPPAAPPQEPNNAGPAH